MSDTRARTSVWQGLNRMPFIADGEMRDMKNLCSDAYPYLTTRKGRKPYSFNIFVPGTAGDGYTADVATLPEPSENEVENIYRVIESLVPGALYTYTDGKWQMTSEGVSKSDAVLSDGQGGTTLSEGCYTYEYANTSTNIGTFYTSAKGYEGKSIKYLGENSEGFEKGTMYKYAIKQWYAWDEYAGTAYDGTWDNLPTPSSSYLRDKLKYSGTTNENYTNGKIYLCCLHVQGVWEKVEGYAAVNSIPENPSEGDTMRYCGTGNYVNGSYYEVSYDVNANGDNIYFYLCGENNDTAISADYIPEATAENIDTVYLYTGVNVEEFAECVYEDGKHIWKKVAHPQVMRTVEFEEYLKTYKEITLGNIIEIAAFLGKMAVLFKTDEGNVKLYYDEKVWDVNNITGEAGKKFSIVGNKLIAGESGSYLHIKNDGTVEFHTSPDSFAVTIEASYAEYGNGGEMAKWSSISGDALTGEATFVILAPGGGGKGFETVYNGLNGEGADFSVEFDGKTYYLESESVTYEKNVEIYAWKVNDWHYDYADRLTIKATGVKESFEWNNNGTGFSLYLTFASTDPHYYDVVTWKKRLWGYKNNVLYGTAADIFDNYDTVDWNRGDNTYMEAISQPIWQGGNITGLAALSNALILFKEDSLTVFTGHYPAIMSGSTIPCRGLPKDNRESVAVGNESVFYLSQDGVYRFSGGIPQCISRNAKISGKNAVGISDGNKYWLSLEESRGYALYVYDINLGIWHKEDAFLATSFTILDGEVYASDNKQIYNISTQQENVEWEMVLWFDEGTHKLKKYKELSFRGYTGNCELQIKGDDGEWQTIRWAEDKLHARFAPFTCEEFMVKLKGRGICQIKSLDRIFEVIE